MIQIYGPTSPKSETNVRAGLMSEGAVLLRDFSSSTFEALVARIGIPYLHPDADAHGVTTIEPRVESPGENLRGFTRSRLAPHTDRATAADPPRIVAILCEKQSHSGGTSLLLDGQRLMPSLIAGSGVDEVHIRDTLLIHQYSTGEMWPVFRQPISDLSYAIRYRDDDIAAPVCHGDPQLVALLRGLILKLVVPHLLGPGQGYILDNHRWLHGRTAFEGDRTFRRILLSDVEAA